MGFYLLSYLCIGVFIAASAYLLYRQFILPLHVRWELYPVQHEPPGKALYGGSYLEEPNWWEKRRKRHLFNELSYMLLEILFLRGLWQKNRRLWQISFPFHLGLYLIVATFGLLLSYALLVLGTVDSISPGDGFKAFIGGLIVPTAWTGLILGAFGAGGLLCRRIFDQQLRSYSSFSDYFNLLFLLIFFASGLVSLSGDPYLSGAKAYLYGLLTGGRPLNGYEPAQSISGGLAIVSASLLAASIPLTHMSHMFMKYFLYHRVRWDDAPNLRGGPIEAAVSRNLELKPTWGAKHVGADGKRSWREIASHTPKEAR